MRALQAMMTEIYGLFVDDGSVALWIVGWLLVSGLLLPRLPMPAELRSVVFALGLAVILAASSVRAAARRQR